MAPPASVGEGDGRTAEGLYGAGLYWACAAGTRVLRTTPAAAGGDPSPAGLGIRPRPQLPAGTPNPAGLGIRPRSQRGTRGRRKAQYDLAMEALWLILVLIVLAVGLFFLVRAFIRLQKQVIEVRKAMAELGDMGPRLQRLGQDMGKLAENIEEKRRQ